MTPEGIGKPTFPVADGRSGHASLLWHKPPEL